MMQIRNPKIPIEVYENPQKIDLEAALYFGETAPDFVFENQLDFENQPKGWHTMLSIIKSHNGETSKLWRLVKRLQEVKDHYSKIISDHEAEIRKKKMQKKESKQSQLQVQIKPHSQLRVQAKRTSQIKNAEADQ